MVETSVRPGAFLNLIRSARQIRRKGEHPRRPVIHLTICNRDINKSVGIGVSVTSMYVYGARGGSLRRMTINRGVGHKAVLSSLGLFGSCFILSKPHSPLTRNIMNM